MSRTTQSAPLRLDPAKLAGEGLDEFPPFPNPPEGFTGTWENTGEVFRELVVIETNTYEQDLQRLPD